MTDFNKTKIHFVLALLGTLFVLHPYVERYGDRGFVYLGFEIRIFYVYAAVAGLFALSVYCFALALVNDRPHSFMEASGNYAYAIALAIPPLVLGLYGASVLAVRVGGHWALSLALALGLIWLGLWQFLVLRLRKKMSQQDRDSKLEQLAHQEIASLDRARTLFQEEHYDLSVIEAWKSIESRLKRALLVRGWGGGLDDTTAMIKTATKKGILHGTAPALLQDLRRQWNIAVSTEPLTREAADKALHAARDILSTIPIDARLRHTL
jgi:hypothetical protein